MTYSLKPIRGILVAATYFPLNPRASMALFTLSALSYDLIMVNANTSANILLCLRALFKSPPPLDLSAFIMDSTIFKVIKMNLYDIRKIWLMGKGNTRYIIAEK